MFRLHFVSLNMTLGIKKHPRINPPGVFDLDNQVIGIYFEAGVNSATKR